MVHINKILFQDTHCFLSAMLGHIAVCLSVLWFKISFTLWGKVTQEYSFIEILLTLSECVLLVRCFSKERYCIHAYCYSCTVFVPENHQNQ